MNARDRARRKLWELTGYMERLQELYCVLNRPLPDTFGDFYESCMNEIEYYDEELDHGNNNEDVGNGKEVP